MTASMDGTSASSGVVQNLGTVRLDSDEMRTKTESTSWAPTTEMGQGIRTRELRERG